MVVLTTSQDDQDVLKSYDLHATCYFQSPWTWINLVRVVRSIEDFWLGIVVLPASNHGTANSKPIHVLLIEDHPGNVRLLRELLDNTGTGAFVVAQVDRLAAGMEHLDARAIDVILLDLSFRIAKGPKR